MFKKRKKNQNIKKIKEKKNVAVVKTESIGIKKILKSKKSWKEKIKMIWKRYSSQMGVIILFIWAIILLLIVFLVLIVFGTKEMQGNLLNLNGLGNKVEEKTISCEHFHPLTGECSFFKESKEGKKKEEQIP